MRDSRFQRQPSLFDKPDPPKAEPPPPNLDLVRKHLSYQLRLARRAEMMPWREADALHWERFFPECARLLPPEEGEPLIAEFAAHFARLKAAGGYPQ